MICLIAARCENRTNGTNTDGSKVNGNCNNAILDCSKANCWNIVGSDNIALNAILRTNARQIKFQISITEVPIFLFTKVK